MGRRSAFGRQAILVYSFVLAALWICTVLTAILTGRLAIHFAQELASDLEAVKAAILAEPDTVEEGLFALDAHLQAGEGGLIDLLAVDGTGALTVLAIQNGGDEEELLLRGLKHQEWVKSQIQFLRQLYGSHRIHPFRDPRAILLAPHFSSHLLDKIAELEVRITPLSYRLPANGGHIALRTETRRRVSLIPAENQPPFLRLADLATLAETLTSEELAAGVQQGLIPRSSPPVRGYDIAGFTLPCRPVGGDSYDFLPQSANRLWISVGDVSGKGLPAAMIMSHFQAFLRGLSEAGRPIFRLVSRLNENLLQILAHNQFISFFVLELKADDGAIKYINAGHNPPLLIHASGQVDRLDESGPVLGVVPGYRYRPHKAHIERGDTLLLYTDGVTESRNLDQEEFGEKRLVDSLRGVTKKDSEAGLATLKKKVLEFSGSAPRHDDITLLLIRRLAS